MQALTGHGMIIFFGSSKIVGRLDRVLRDQAWIDTHADTFYEYHSYATTSTCCC